MNGPIAQIVALTCHANAFLRGKRIPRLFPTNSTCQFCDRVTFVEFVKPLFGSQQEKTVAQNPDEWFALLRVRNTHGVRLARSSHSDPRISDRMSAGFIGGGGIWSMEVLLPKQQSDFWAARWEVWNQNALTDESGESPTDGFPRHKVGLLRIRICLRQKVAS